MNHLDTLNFLDSKGHENVPLLSEQYGKRLSQLTAAGNVNLLDNRQSAMDTAAELHAGSMRNIEAALNETIKKNPGISFYILKCMRRDFKNFTTFHEVIQVRPMHCPVPRTPGMTLLQWDHAKQQLYLLWSLPVEHMLDITLEREKDKYLVNQTKDYLYHQKKINIS